MSIINGWLYACKGSFHGMRKWRLIISILTGTYVTQVKEPVIIWIDCIMCIWMLHLSCMYVTLLLPLWYACWFVDTVCHWKQWFYSNGFFILELVFQIWGSVSGIGCMEEKKFVCWHLMSLYISLICPPKKYGTRKFIHSFHAFY